MVIVRCKHLVTCSHCIALQHAYWCTCVCMHTFKSLGSWEIPGHPPWHETLAVIDLFVAVIQYTSQLVSAHFSLFLSSLDPPSGGIQTAGQPSTRRHSWCGDWGPGRHSQRRVRPHPRRLQALQGPHLANAGL